MRLQGGFLGPMISDFRDYYTDKIEKYGNTERFDNFTDQVRPICQKVILLNTGQSDEGGGS